MKDYKQFVYLDDNDDIVISKEHNGDAYSGWYFCQEIIEQIQREARDAALEEVSEILLKSISVDVAAKEIRALKCSS